MPDCLASWATELAIDSTGCAAPMGASSSTRGRPSTLATSDREPTRGSGSPTAERAREPCLEGSVPRPAPASRGPGPSGRTGSGSGALLHLATAFSSARQGGAPGRSPVEAENDLANEPEDGCRCSGVVAVPACDAKVMPPGAGSRLPCSPRPPAAAAGCASACRASYSPYKLAALVELGLWRVEIFRLAAVEHSAPKRCQRRACRGSGTSRGRGSGRSQPDDLPRSASGCGSITNRRAAHLRHPR